MMERIVNKYSGDCTQERVDVNDKIPRRNKSETELHVEIISNKALRTA